MRTPPRTGSGIAGKLLVGLLVLAAVVVGADFGLRLWAEARVAGQVAQSLNMSSRPDVDLHGFPFVLQFSEGRFDRVDVRAESVEAEGLVLQSVVLELRDVRFSRGELLTGEPGVIRARRGSGEAMVTDDAMSAMVQEQGQPVDVEFLGPRVRVSTTLTIGEEQLEASATGRLQLDEGILSFSPRRVDVAGRITVPTSTVSFEVPLPELIPGMRYDAIEVEEGAATLEVRVRDAAIHVPPAR